MKNSKWNGRSGWVIAALLALSASAHGAGFDLEAPGAGDSVGGYDDLFRSCMATVKKDCESWAFKGGGSDAPRGLANDTRVELAQGERYVLSGGVEVSGSTPFLRIDFRAHPWLANRTRVLNPFYRIAGNTEMWRKLRGRRVTIVAVAKVAIKADAPDGRSRLEVYLDPSGEPMVGGPPRSRR